MSTLDLLFAAGAGLLAGMVNAAAGGGTLVSYPALVALGQLPVAATVTSNIGLLPGYAGTAWSYRRELRGLWPPLRRLLVPAIVGGGVGAVLLLATSDEVLGALVPWLIGAASVLLALQPRLAALVRARGPTGGELPGPVTVVVIALGAVYGGFFGAGLGVVLLAVLGIALVVDLQGANALKSALSFAANAAGVVYLVFSADVEWALSGVLAVSSLVGGYLGGLLARRLPGAWLRGVVVVAGLVVAVILFVN